MSAAAFVRDVTIVVLACSALPALPDSARAQTAVALVPRAGVLVPLNALGDAPSSTQIPGTVGGSSRAELGGGAVLGFAVTFDRHALPFVLRADVDVAPTLPVRLDGARSAYDVTLAMLTAGVMTRVVETGRVRPHAHVGIGMRSLRSRVSVSHGPQLPTERLDPQGRLGGGVDLVVGPATLRAELESQLASFRSEEVQGAGGERSLHADLALTLGVRLPLR